MTGWWKGLDGIKGLLAQGGRGLVDAVYPLECVGCGKAGRVICGRCYAGLPVLSPPFCEICAAPGDFIRCPPCQDDMPSFDGIRAPFRYAGTVRQAVLSFKYGGIRAAAPQLGGMLADYLRDHPLPGDLMAAVPMHPRRQRERGYNQAELLAREVSGRNGLEYRGDLLARSRQVAPQAGTATAAERATNVAGSVAVKGDCDLAGVGIIVVDDVATTGNTLEACAAALKEAGAQSVWGLTLAISDGRSRGE